MVPHHKAELLSCLEYGPCAIFKEQQLTHVAIQLYFSLVIHQLRKVARMYQFLRIRVRSGMFQERGLWALCRSEEGPFIAYPQLHCPASLTPPEFDEQYVDYGQNKLIWIFRLRLLDYKFRVLYHSFAVHVPHPSSSYDGYLHSMRNKGKLTEMDLHMKVGSLRWVGRRNSSRSCDSEELRCARCFPCVRGQSSLFCGVWSNRNSYIIELCVCFDSNYVSLWFLSSRRYLRVSVHSGNNGSRGSLDHGFPFLQSLFLVSFEEVVTYL